jgi:DNA modification methylase
MAIITLKHGDVIEQLKTLDDDSIDAIITDPPYNLTFAGKKWDDKGAPLDFEEWCKSWSQECLRVLRVGGYMVSFGGTRTFHRMASGIEDAGFVIKDCLSWNYGSGFPKSHDVSKSIDKRGGKDVSWFGTWLREWRNKNNIKQKDVAKLFPSKTGKLTGCVANWELGFNLPTNEQFNKICKEFDLPFESLEEAEREVVGKKKTNLTVYREIGRSNTSGDIEVTVASTDEAKLWEGYGTALKPAWEPIILAQKPIKGTIAHNVLTNGVGAMNIDSCRISLKDGETKTGGFGNAEIGFGGGDGRNVEWKQKTDGRWPANVILQHHSECELIGQKVVKGNGHAPKLSKGNPFGGKNDQAHEERHYNNEIVEDWVCHDDCPIHVMDAQSGVLKPATSRTDTISKGMFAGGLAGTVYPDKGGASRFFYQPKVSKKERSCNGLVENTHPTVKPIALMDWLIKLVCPNEKSMNRRPIVLDCFIGSGATAIAAHRLGVDCIGIDADADSLRTTQLRLKYDNTLWEGIPVPHIIGDSKVALASSIGA